MGTQTVADLVAAAKATIENLDPDAVAREIEAGQALLVDIREQEERYRNGSVGGAVHASRGMLEFYADGTSPYHRPEFSPQRRMILFCASGGRSALAVKSLEGLGYDHIAHLEGGFNAWKAAGRPIAPGSASGASW